MTDSPALDALPAALAVRPVRYIDGAVAAADLDDVVELVNTCDINVVGEVDSGRDDMASMFASPATDRDATVLIHDDQGVVGFVWIERDDTARSTWIDVYAHPERWTTEVLDAGLRHGLQAARRHRDAAGPGSWKATSGSFGNDADLGGALERAGFTRVRRFWRMRIDFAEVELPSQPAPLPDDVRLVVVHDDAARRALFDVRQDSFRDHWDFVDRGYDEFLEQSDALGSNDPDGWWLVEVDGVPAAICMLDESRAELGDGYVRTLGVARAFRGRGLGQLLLERAFLYYRDLGRSGVQLSVDSDSPTGANHLYEKVGMRARRIMDAWTHSL